MVEKDEENIDRDGGEEDGMEDGMEEWSDEYYRDPNRSEFLSQESSHPFVQASS